MIKQMILKINLKKLNSISPLIATILLIVVSIAIIGIIVLWGKNFTNSNLSLTETVYDKSDLSNFVFQENLTGTNLIIKNSNSTETAIITSYKINTFVENNFFRLVHNLDENIVLNSYELAQINLGCIPEAKFSIDLITSNNEYINVPIIADSFDPSACTELLYIVFNDANLYIHPIIQVLLRGTLMQMF